MHYITDCYFSIFTFLPSLETLFNTDYFLSIVDDREMSKVQNARTIFTVLHHRFSSKVSYVLSTINLQKKKTLKEHPTLYCGFLFLDL